jgi:hypothetical protein
MHDAVISGGNRRSNRGEIKVVGKFIYRELIGEKMLRGVKMGLGI